MKIGITHGDFNGANYEILLKMFEEPHIVELFTPVIYGSPRVAAWYKKSLNLPQFQFNFIEKVEQAKEGMVNLVNVIGEDEPEITPGVPSEIAGNAARIALERCVEDLRSGAIDVMVTLPINKDTIQSEHFKFPGHTEFLEERLGNGDDTKALMILCSDKMRVALVTTHVPIAEVPSLITKENVLEKIRIFNQSLKKDFLLTAPRIAVLALNPHNGENGLLGKEEQEAIMPALEEARKEGILAFGPYSADGFFGAGSYKEFDGIIAMYHDQGLIPFKTIAMDEGVNYTAGLDYIRTSPDHGTAYDIAGKNAASTQSTRSAIYMAMDIKRNRDAYNDAHRNPLQKHYNTTNNPRE